MQPLAFIFLSSNDASEECGEGVDGALRDEASLQWSSSSGVCRGFRDPVMEREGVILLALPTSFLPSKWIQQGQDGDAEALFGPSVEVMVQAMEEDEAGQEVLLEIEIPCLLLQPN